MPNYTPKYRGLPRKLCQPSSLYFLETESSDGSPVLPTYFGDLGQLPHPLGMSHL